MRLLEHYLLQEKKDHLIKRLPGLTQEEKDQVITFFASHANLENKIDWNNKNLQMSDFNEVINSVSQSKGKIRKIGLDAFTEGEDYINITKDDQMEMFIPLNWKFQNFIQSKRYRGTDGKWCIGYTKNDSFWNRHLFDRNIFVILINNDHEKVAVQTNNTGMLFWDHTDSSYLDYEFKEEYPDFYAYWEENLSYIQKEMKKALEQLITIGNDLKIKNKIKYAKEMIKEIKEILNEDKPVDRYTFNEFLKNYAETELGKIYSDKIYPWFYKLFSRVEQLEHCFSGLDFENLQDLDFKKFKLSEKAKNCVDLHSLFFGSTRGKIDLSQWHFNKPVNIYQAFSWCRNLEVTLGPWDIDGVEKLLYQAKNVTIYGPNIKIDKDWLEIASGMGENCKITAGEPLIEQFIKRLI